MNHPMTSLILRFQAIDALFFRELRPQGGPGGMPLQSLFPPPPRTFSGTIHQLLHDATGTSMIPPDQRGGHATKWLESLRLRGPWLAYLAGEEQANQVAERLFPWPAHILRHKSGHSVPLAPAGTALKTDLGRIFVPTFVPTFMPTSALGLPHPAKDYHASLHTWITETDFIKLLANPHHQVSQCFDADADADADADTDADDNFIILLDSLVATGFLMR